MSEVKEPPDALVSQALSLLPYLLNKREVALAQAVRDLHLQGGQVKQLVRILQFCGVPPYGGGDTFDCYLQGATIRLETARGAPIRPSRLTREETLALAVGVHIAGEIVPGGARLVKGLREKLTLAAASQCDLAIPLDGERTARGATTWLPMLRSAASKRNVVRMSYYSLRGGKLGDRMVEPWRLYYLRGHWHLLAYCRMRRREAVFRLDRIREASMSQETFPARTRRLREPTPHYETPPLSVEIVLPEEEARYLEERESPFLRGVDYLGDGRARIQVVSDSLPWVIAFVMRYAGEAVVEQPKAVREAVRRAAEEILLMYRKREEGCVPEQQREPEQEPHGGGET